MATLPEEKIYNKVRAYIGTIRTYLIQQVKFHLYLKYGASYLPGSVYSPNWKDHEISRQIFFLINSLEKHRYSSASFQMDVQQNPEKYCKSLKALEHLLEIAKENSKECDQTGINLMTAFKQDIFLLYRDSLEVNNLEKQV